MTCTMHRGFSVAWVLAVVALTSVVAAVPALAAQGDLEAQAVWPSTHTVAFRGATGVAILPDGAAATFEKTIFVTDPQARSVVGILGDGTLLGPWTGAGGESFVEPTDVAADLSGHIYVADKGRPYVYKLDAATGALVEKIGSGLVDAVGIDWLYVSGGGHQIFVADAAAARIVRFSDSGDLSGGAWYTAGAQLYAPSDVKAQPHADGLRLWVTDSDRDMVFCIDALSDTARAQWGESGTGAGELSAPVGVAVRDDYGNDILVSDASGSVRRFTQGGVLVETLVAPGTGEGQVAQPQRIALDPGNDWMWIAEKGAGRAQLFNGLGESRRLVGGGPGTQLGQFDAPTALAINGPNLLVCDSGNNRIQAWDLWFGTPMYEFGEEGTADGQFSYPSGIAVDREANVYVSDTLNHRVQKFDGAGNHLATWGSYGAGPGQFDMPKGIAVDSEGYVYVADSGNYRISKFAPNGDMVTSWSSYVYKSQQRNLYRLSDIAMGPDDRLFVYDGFNGPSAQKWWVPEFDSDGALKEVHFDVPSGILDGRWAGLDVSASRTLYLCESDSVWPPTVHMKPWLPDFYETDYHARTSSGAGPGQFAVAGDVAIGPLGMLFVSDPALHRVQRFAVEDTQGPRTQYVTPNSWVSGDSGVSILRPTDGLAGPLETYVRLNGGEPFVIWSASEEATANPSRYVPVTAEGTTTVEFWAVDGFGNAEEANTVFVTIDRKHPEATVTVSPSGWTQSDVEVSIEATDSGAGVASIEWSTNRDGVPLTDPASYVETVTITEEGVTGVRFDVTDGAGKKTIKGAQAKIDRTDPVTTIWPSPLVPGPGTRLWAAVTGAGSEQESESSTYWRVDGGLPEVGSFIELPVPGTYALDYWSVDPAGNIESEQTTQVVVADTGGGDGGGDGDVPPSGDFQIAQGRAWFNSTELPVTLNVDNARQMRFMVTGDADWRDWVDYAPQTTLSVSPSQPDGEWLVSAQFRSRTDDEGLLTGINRSVGIDRTPPHTTSNASEGRNFDAGEPITLAANDDRSGPARMWYSIDGQAPVEYTGVLTFQPGQYRFSWWTVDIAGNTESPHEATLTVVGPVVEPIPALLTATSRSATIAYGGTYYLTGRLTANGQPLGSKPVMLQQFSGAWLDTTTFANTDANGYYTFALKPTSKRGYRPRFVADAEYEGAVGAEVYVTPRASVGTPVAPATMYRGKAKTVYGYLRPRHAQGSYPVRIYKYRYVSGKWKNYGYVKAKATNYLTYTKYSASVKLPYKGKWRLRSYHPADSGHPAAWSAKYDSVTVK